MSIADETDLEILNIDEVYLCYFDDEAQVRVVFLIKTESVVIVLWKFPMAVWINCSQKHQIHFFLMIVKGRWRYTYCD